MLKPLDNRVIVQLEKAAEQTPGGIALPASAREEMDRGKVVAVGPGALLPEGARAPMTVREGQTVLLAKYAGTEIEDEGRTVTIVRETEILAVLED